MVRTAGQNGSPLGLLVVDVDNLKSLNDLYGHLTGAEGVRTVGHIIGRHLPPAAVACRYGGDEFAIAVPDCNRVRARRIAEELCEAVRASAPTLGGRVFQAATLTISVGATSTPRRELPTDDAEAGECLFKQADHALYEAKGTGVIECPSHGRVLGRCRGAERPLSEYDRELPPELDPLTTKPMVEIVNGPGGIDLALELELADLPPGGGRGLSRGRLGAG